MEQTSFDRELAARLDERHSLDLYRSRKLLASAQAPSVIVGEKKLSNFCSNDYLGLANHPALTKAASSVFEHAGFGGGASHLVCGHSSEHHALEEELAAFTGRDKALLFSTGYMANIGVIQAICGREDGLFEDKLNHASLLDGAMLSRAKLKRFVHADAEHLDGLLSQSSARRKLIVTDGVFSMDGDCAPLPKIVNVSKKHDAVLMVDDAHGFGCLGASGAGLQEVYGLDQATLPVLVGTLGKAFGSFGAFVAGSEQLIETLVQFARSYIYTTSMPPAVAAASRAALKLIQSESWRREKLQHLIKYLRRACADRGINLMPSNTPIQPVLIGDSKQALDISNYMFDHGVWLTAIRPPTVPAGGARLRITLSAEHSEKQIDTLVEALYQAMKIYASEQGFE